MKIKHMLRSKRLTFGFDNKKEHKHQFEDKPSAIYDVIPPGDGFERPGIDELVESNCGHDREVLDRQLGMTLPR